MEEPLNSTDKPHRQTNSKAREVLEKAKLTKDQAATK